MVNYNQSEKVGKITGSHRAECSVTKTENEFMFEFKTWACVKAGDPEKIETRKKIFCIFHQIITYEMQIVEQHGCECCSSKTELSYKKMTELGFEIITF